MKAVRGPGYDAEGKILTDTTISTDDHSLSFVCIQCKQHRPWFEAAGWGPRCASCLKDVSCLKKLVR